MLCERMEENVIFYMVRRHFAGVGLIRNASPACHFRALDPSVLTAARCAGELLHLTGSLWTTHTVSLTPARQ